MAEDRSSQMEKANALNRAYWMNVGVGVTGPDGRISTLPYWAAKILSGSQDVKKGTGIVNPLNIGNMHGNTEFDAGVNNAPAYQAPDVPISAGWNPALTRQFLQNFSTPEGPLPVDLLSSPTWSRPVGAPQPFTRRGVLGDIGGTNMGRFYPGTGQAYGGGGAAPGTMMNGVPVGSTPGAGNDMGSGQLRGDGPLWRYNDPVSWGAFSGGAPGTSSAWGLDATGNFVDISGTSPNSNMTTAVEDRILRGALSPGQAPGLFSTNWLSGSPMSAYTRRLLSRNGLLSPMEWSANEAGKAIGNAQGAWGEMGLNTGAAQTMGITPGGAKRAPSWRTVAQV